MKVTIKATPELAKLAKEADEMQNASNLCGLSQRFAEVMVELVNMRNPVIPPNMHPIARMWIDKFCSLARLDQDWNVMSEMYRVCRELEAERDVEFEVNPG